MSQFDKTEINENTLFILMENNKLKHVTADPEVAVERIKPKNINLGTYDTKTGRVTNMPRNTALTFMNPTLTIACKNQKEYTEDGINYHLEINESGTINKVEVSMQNREVTDVYFLLNPQQIINILNGEERLDHLVISKYVFYHDGLNEVAPFSNWKWKR